jgi:hypothetical protein
MNELNEMNEKNKNRKTSIEKPYRNPHMYSWYS